MRARDLMAAATRPASRHAHHDQVRVAHVTTIADSLEALLANQLHAIRAQGFDVAGVSAAGRAVQALERSGIRHVPVPFVRATGLTPWSDLRAFAELVRVFRRERFTIVHTHTAKPDLYAAMAARVAGVPIVVTTLHGFLFHDLTPPNKRRFYAGLARLGMRCCDVVLSQNPEDVDTARRDHICAPDKIEVLGNGIDLTRFDRARADEARRTALRADLGIASDAPVIGFVGRLVEEKGVLDLFEAMRLLRASHPRARLLLIGMIDDAKQDAIRPATAERHGVADMCIFTGHRRDLPELYSLMDVSVLPSHREGFPRTPMEASAMGVPVVATNIRGCRTAVEDGRTGLLVPVRDPIALARALRSLLDSPDRRRAMGAEGRLVAHQKFDERVVFDKVLSTYQRLLAARGLSQGEPA